MPMQTNQLNHSPELAYLARKYVWWEPADWAFHHSEVFLSNVMNLGDWEDIELLQKVVSKKMLKELLKKRPIGVFNQRSWDYWHAKLGLGQAPSLPRRRF